MSLNNGLADKQNCYWETEDSVDYTVAFQVTKGPFQASINSHLTSLSLVPITSLLGDPRFYCPIFYFVCHWIGYNWNAALSSLSKNHGNHIGNSGRSCPSLFGWNDRFFHDSYILAGCRFRQVSSFFLILFTDLGVAVPPCQYLWSR